MTSKIPSDARLRAYIERKIQSVSDVSFLSRTIIKDSIAQKYKLTHKERERLDTDNHLKSSIKLWIKDAINSLPDKGSSVSEVTKPESKQTPEKNVEKPISIPRIELKQSIKPPSISKSKFESSKSTTPVKPTSESNLKRKSDSEQKSSKEAKVPKHEEKKVKVARKERETTLDEFSSMDESEDDKKKRKKARSSTSTSTSKSANVGGISSKAKASSSSADASENGLVKTEAKLKNLKKIVLLCGTRKPWKKLFEEAGCPDVEADNNIVNVYERQQKQVRVVEQVLKDLGMTAPFTQAKADPIREEKEAKEEADEIRLANTTTKRETRGSREKKDDGPSTSMGEKSVATDAPIPEAKIFSNYLADLVAEMNNQ